MENNQFNIQNRSQTVNQQSQFQQNIESGQQQPNHTYSTSQSNLRSSEQQAKLQIDYAKKKKKRMKLFGIICMGIFAVSLFTFGTTTANVDTTSAARQALQNGQSTSIAVGTVLMSKDEKTETKDYTLKNTTNVKSTKIYVWDYADQDGDYVQVLVNGTPVSDAFMIFNKPKVFMVPAEGTVQIKGVKDGYGGISYAIRFDLNGTTYFNDAPTGGENTFTIT